MRRWLQRVAVVQKRLWPLADVLIELVAREILKDESGHCRDRKTSEHEEPGEKERGGEASDIPNG